MRNTILLTTCVLAVACSPSSPKLIPPAKQVEQKKATATLFQPTVDILFVVDDSGSMDRHQERLAKNVELFTQNLQQLQFIDYHIGVTTTSTSGYQNKKNPLPPNKVTFRRGVDGALVGPYIDRNTRNGMDILKNQLIVGTSGSSTEKMFPPMLLAITPPNTLTTNLGFYRPDARFAVIMITDAEEQSDYTAQDAYQELLKLKNGDKTKIITYGAIVPSNDNMDCPRDQGDKPFKLETFFQLTGGIFYGLCDDDYGLKLANLGKDLAAKVAKYIYLDVPPDISSISVRFGNLKLPNDEKYGWSYDHEKNAIVLGDLIDWSSQPNGSQLVIDFEAAEYPSQKQ